MAINVVDLAKEYLTSAVINKVSTVLGENPDNTQKAITGALPAVLGGLISKAEGPGGSDLLSSLLTQFGGTTTLPTSTETQTTSVIEGLIQNGGGLISSLFGDTQGAAVANAISTYSGVNASSATGLLGMAGSLLMNVLSRQTGASGGAGSLVNLLTSQKESMQSALPAGLGSLLGAVPGLGALSGMFGSAGTVASQVQSPTEATYRTIPDSVENTAVETSSGLSRLWPWLALVAGALLIWYFLRGCENKPTSTAAVTDSTSTMVHDATASVDSAASSAGAAIDSAATNVKDGAANAMSALGSFFTYKLPNGVELTIPESGIENKLVKFIENKQQPVDKTAWFNFNRLLFKTGKATLVPESKEEVKNIAEILKAFPKVAIKLGGYTDNTGSADLNQKLSQARAEAVMSELVTMGIAKTRLAAEGYGPEHPVATNDTEAGRAQNRRIAVRVTEK